MGANFVTCFVGLVLSVALTESASPLQLDAFAGHDREGALVEVLNRSNDQAGIDAMPGNFRSIAPQMQGTSQLWVDAAFGNDGNDGLSRETAFRSIQRAADIASPGTTVHILPGTYREAVRPALSGTAAEPIIYVAEDGAGTVRVRGSERADTLVWSPLVANTIGLPSGVDPGNVYYADVAAWGLAQAPRFVVQLNAQGDVAARLPLAREPDWQVATAWKYGEFWWAADGGSRAAACDPATNQDPDCDSSTRSTLQLTDRTNDSQPAGIEPGNLTTVGDMTGATLVALDTNTGHYVYRRKVVAHDVAAGKVTVDQAAEFDSGSGRPGLGWGSKYYVENRPSLLDTPGEWWYDTATSRLYLWPPQSVSPSTLNIEISRQDAGFDLRNRSYITVDGLTVELFNGSAIREDNNDNNRSYHNTVRNSTLRYMDIGVDLEQGVGSLADNITDGFTLENSELGHLDSYAIFSNYWWSGGTADTFTHAGILNTVIRNNEMYDLAFRNDSDNADGIKFAYPNKLRFEGNHVHDVAHNGVIIGRSIIQSAKARAFAPSEIKIGEILIKDNLIEKTCQMAADCGAVKIEGGAPDYHVHRDLLITGNVFRNSFGWTSVSQLRGRWGGGTNSAARGMGGFGLYSDNASGLYAYRNIAYNNGYSDFNFYNSWWDGDLVVYNNLVANSLHGIYLGGVAQSSINTQIANNMLVNNEGHGILIFQGLSDYGNFRLDYNLYYANGWRTFEQGGMWQAGDMTIRRPSTYYLSLAAIQAGTSWEDHGVEGDPQFVSYDVADHDLFDGSWPDFHLTTGSTNALDRGTTAQLASLERLLAAFGVKDALWGQAYEIGRYEEGFRLALSSTGELVSPCSEARFSLRSDSPDLPYDITLAVTSPSPFLNVHLSSPHLSPHEVVILTVSESLMGGLLLPQVAYTIPITAVGEGFTARATVRVLVGGIRTCIPIGLQDWLVGAKGSG